MKSTIYMYLVIWVIKTEWRKCLNYTRLYISRIYRYLCSTMNDWVSNIIYSCRDRYLTVVLDIGFEGNRYFDKRCWNVVGGCGVKLRADRIVHRLCWCSFGVSIVFKARTQWDVCTSESTTMVTSGRGHAPHLEDVTVCPSVCRERERVATTRCIVRNCIQQKVRRLFCGSCRFLLMLICDACVERGSMGFYK